MARTSRIGVLFTLAVMLLVTLPALAAEVILQPGAAGKDTYTWGANPANNYGGVTYFYFGGDCTGGQYRLYIEFDLSNLTPGSTVTAAQLELYMCSQNGFINTYYYGVYEVLDEWSETGLTWNNQPLHDPSATAQINGNDWQGDIGMWQVVGGLGGLVQGWIDDPTSNHGIVIRPNASFYGAPMFWTGDYASSSLRPRLVLNGGVTETEPSTWGSVKDLYR